MSEALNPEKARIFRILHVANVSWILDHGGLPCQNSSERDPNYLNIGNTSLIEKRSRLIVPVPPGGTLSDYVPFYFTPFSIMMYNIKTGFGGISRRENSEIVIVVSSIHRLRDLGLPEQEPVPEPPKKVAAPQRRKILSCFRLNYGVTI